MLYSSLLHGAFEPLVVSISQTLVGLCLNQEKRFLWHPPKGHIGFEELVQRLRPLVDSVHVADGFAKQYWAKEARYAEQTTRFLEDFRVTGHG